MLLEFQMPVGFQLQRKFLVAKSQTCFDVKERYNDIYTQHKEEEPKSVSKTLQVSLGRATDGQF